MIPHPIASALLLPGLLATTPPPALDGPTLVVAKRAVQGMVNAAAGANEYPVAAQAINGIAGSTVRVQTYRSADGLDEEIQFLITIGDNTVDGSGDLVRLYFDTNHNDLVNDPADREVEIRRNGTAVIGEVNVSGAPSSPVALPGGQVMVTGNGVGDPSWTVEVKLEAADLNMNGIPSHMGVYLYAADGVIGEGHWPMGATGPNADTWATLKTRYPIDYMIVLDQSGSMLSQNKWVDAKNASSFFASTMAALADPTYFADRVGLVTFAWLCSGGGNLTATPKALAAPVVGTYTTGVADPIGNNCTPIGEGIEMAFTAGNLNATVADATQQKDRGVLLLSDGLQNMPSSTFNPGDTGYDPCPATPGWNPCPMGTESNVQVGTVAFGQGDWEVDTDLLQDVQERYLGTIATTFTMASNPDDLKEDFLNGLEDFYTTNMLYSDVPAGFVVDPDHDRLVVIASWSTPASAQAIQVRDDGNPLTCATSNTSTQVGFAICTIESPPPGTYTVTAPGGGALAPAPTRLFAVADLRLRARFSVDPVNAGTGDPLLLTAELRDGGQPVRNTPPSNPVQVRVRIQNPEEGVGTFATVHDASCKRIEPQLPRPNSVRGGQQTPTHTVPGGAAGGTPDPQPPLYAQVSALLDACGRPGLPRGDDGLEMYDDGTHGDVTAGDGVYSLTYIPQVEGTYSFRFDVEGTTAGGAAFARTRRMGKYVRVQPAPEASQSGSRILQQLDASILAEYWVLPRDRFGGYMGPGRGRHVDFTLQGNGTFVGGVVDYGNGYYARRVQYDPRLGLPVVTPTIDGEPLKPIGSTFVGPTGGGGGRGRFEFGVFAAYTGFDDGIGLDDGMGLGARLGLSLIPALTLEGEVAATWTEAGGESGQMWQAFGNARLDLSGGMWETFLRAGAGQVFFRGFSAEDEATAYHAGGGFTLWLGPLGVRADARALRIDAVGGADATTNWQGQAGVVVRF